MDEVAIIAPRHRKVRCPNCGGFLTEPGSPIYECPFCCTLLLAKGTPPDFKGESWQMPLNENNQGIQGSRHTNELEASSIDGSEVIRSQREDQLNDHKTNVRLSMDAIVKPQHDHETNGHVSKDGNIKHQEQLLENLRSEVVSDVESKKGRELQNDTRNGSMLVGDIDKLTGDASKTGTTIAVEGLAVEMLKPLDCGVEEGALVSSSDVSQEAPLLSYHMNDQGALSKGDEKSISKVLLEDVKNCSMPNAIEEEKEFVGECEGVKGRNHKEFDAIGEGSELVLQSEVVEDNDNELSSKYINSVLESNDQLAPKMRMSRLSKPFLESSIDLHEMLSSLRERLPYSSDEDSDSDKSDSIASEPVSHVIKDSEFDFPSASAESMHPSNLSQLPLLQKKPLPDVNGEVPLTPHQLVWQDVDLENEEIALQNSNGAADSSAGADVESSSDAQNGMEQGGKVERDESDGHLQKEDPIMKEILSVKIHTAAIDNEPLHTQREDGFTGIGVMAHTVGSADLKGGDSVEGKEDSKGHQCNLFDQLNEHTSMSNNVLQEEASESPDLSSSGAEQPLKLRAGSMLKEGNTANTLMLGMQPPMCLVSDGSELETCLAAQEPIHSAANVKLDDSVATIVSENAVITVDASPQKIASQIVFFKEFLERVPDPLHLRQNMLLPAANNDNKRASTSNGVLAKRGGESVNLAPNKEPEYTGIQSFPFGTEQGSSSSDDAFNNVELKLHHKRSYLSEATKYHNREGTKMFDSRMRKQGNCASEESELSEGTRGHDREGRGDLYNSRPHHQRHYSSEESEISSTYTSQVEKRMHNNGFCMPGSMRIMEGSSRTHQRHIHAAFELADLQGPCRQQQNHQAHLHMMDHTLSHSAPLNNAYGLPPANLQHGSVYSPNGSDSFARGAPNASSSFSHEISSHPWRPPVGMLGHGFVHCGCHSAAPLCMACIHCQHSHLPQPSMPPCGLCFNQPLLMAHQQVQADLWNGHQAHQIEPSDQGSSGVCSSLTYLSPQAVHRHDTVMSGERFLAQSARRPKHYPPLPRENAAPYIICKACDEILQVPMDITRGTRATQKLRCGVCYKVAKFCALEGNQGTCNGALQSKTSEASTSTSQASLNAVQYHEYTGQPPVSNVAQSMESSYHQGMDSGLQTLHKQGSFGSQQQISAAIKRRSHSSSLDERVQSTQCEAGTTDHDSQDEFFFRSLSRHCEFDSSRIFFNGFKASSSAIGASTFCDDGLVIGNGSLPMQALVDEKDEGLDFGAPRVSDGESLDQRSPESQKQSPENKSHFQVPVQNRHTKEYLENVDARSTTQHLAFDSKRKNIAQGKKAHTSLIALLSQESSKFEINMDTLDDSKSALLSMPSNLQMQDHHSSDRSNAGNDSACPQPCKLTSARLVRRGTRYVADMLIRSLKDLHRGNR